MGLKDRDGRGQGQIAGPFLAAVPVPPTNGSPPWSDYSAGYTTNTDGTFSLTELTLAPRFPGPVPHRHREHVDSFYVLDGTLTLRLGKETVEARPGSYAVVVPGVTHTFSNPSDETVRALNVMAPGGFEQYLKEAAAATGQGPPDPAVMTEIASRYDFEAVE